MRFYHKDIIEVKVARRKAARKAAYAQAIREYATTAESLKSIAQRHGFVYNSLNGYIIRNCPEEREAHR